MAKKFERKNGPAFLTGTVRINHAFLVKPDTVTEYGKKDAVKKYKAELIVRRDDKTTLRAIKAALAQFGEVTKHPLITEDGEIKDGDLRDDPNYADCYYFPVSNQFQIACAALDENGEAFEIQPSEIKNGDYVEVSIVPSLYDPGEVTFYAQAICKIADGEPLASAAVNISVFNKPKAAKAEATPTATVKKAPVQVVEESDEVEEEEEVPTKKATLKSAKTVTTATSRPSPTIPSEDEDEDIFAKPAPKAKKGKSFDALV